MSKPLKGVVRPWAMIERKENCDPPLQDFAPAHMDSNLPLNLHLPTCLYAALEGLISFRKHSISKRSHFPTLLLSSFGVLTLPS